MIGGIGLVMLAAVFLGTFVLPSKYVKGYAWENTWGAFFFIGMLVVPVLFPYLALNGLWETYSGVSAGVIFGVMALGFLWGCAFCCWGYGLAMVGLSLGYSICMGTQALVGSMVPFFLGSADKAATTGGMFVIGGILICIAGVAINGFAGMQREKAETGGESQESAPKSSMLAGLLLCVLAGLLASGLNIAFHIGGHADVPQFSVESGLQSDLDGGKLSESFRGAFQDRGISLEDKVEITKDKQGDSWQIKDTDTEQTFFVEKTDGELCISVRGIAEVSRALGNAPWLTGLSVWTLICLGGFISAFGFAMIQLFRNKTWKHFWGERACLNMTCAAIMAVAHFGCLFFYGVGGYFIGALGTSVGFAIFQSGSLLIGNSLGVMTGEWKDAGAKSRKWLFVGLTVLILGIVVVSYGNAVI